MKSKICFLLTGVCSLFLSINANAETIGKNVSKQNVDFCDKTTHPIECKANTSMRDFDWLIQYQTQHETLQCKFSTNANTKTNSKSSDNKQDIDYDRCVINTHDPEQCKALELLNFLNRMIKNEIQEISKEKIRIKTNILLKQYDLLMQYTHRTDVVKAYHQKRQHHH